MNADSATVEALLSARRAGLTLRRAAAVAGVRVATVCRWQKRDPGLKAALQWAAEDAWFKLAPEYKLRPSVRWHRDCPLCKARVMVRTARSGLRFWRCGRWPGCRYFGCRHCHELTYASCQESRKYDGLFRRVAADMGQDFATVKRVMQRMGKRPL
jgi:hypothetical protein